jgi:hypothetical protein
MQLNDIVGIILERCSRCQSGEGSIYGTFLPSQLPPTPRKCFSGPFL